MKTLSVGLSVLFSLLTFSASVSAELCSPAILVDGDCVKFGKFLSYDPTPGAFNANTELGAATFSGNVEKVRSLLSLPTVNPNEKVVMRVQTVDNDFFVYSVTTPVAFMALFNQAVPDRDKIEILKLYFARSEFDKNAMRTYGDRENGPAFGKLLFWAVNAGRTEVVKFLLEDPAFDINEISRNMPSGFMNSYELSTLALAYSEKNESNVQLKNLLKADPRVNLENIKRAVLAAHEAETLDEMFQLSGATLDRLPIDAYQWFQVSKKIVNYGRSDLLFRIMRETPSEVKIQNLELWDWILYRYATAIGEDLLASPEFAALTPQAQTELNEFIIDKAITGSPIPIRILALVYRSPLFQEMNPALENRISDYAWVNLVEHAFGWNDAGFKADLWQALVQKASRKVNARLLNAAAFLHKSIALKNHDVSRLLIAFPGVDLNLVSSGVTPLLEAHIRRSPLFEELFQNPAVNPWLENAQAQNIFDLLFPSTSYLKDYLKRPGHIPISQAQAREYMVKAIDLDDDELIQILIPYI